MRELSLFTGAGGGLLGTYLLEWTPIGYVEYDDYCQRVIAQRIRDGILPNAPIFGDVRTFISDGYAAAYQGMVDVISGGFPCQPFSVAGKRAGADDARNMWPATAECVRIIRPRFCFFENVPGLLNSGYFGRIVADLAACGYGVRWRLLSAAEVGAPHKRDRLWIVANDDKARFDSSRICERLCEAEPSKSMDQDMAYTEHIRRNNATRQREVTRMEQRPRWSQESPSVEQSTGSGTRSSVSGMVSDAAIFSQREPADEADAIAISGDTWQELGGGGWWATEPDVGRVANGVAARVDRLKALGNGQVSLVAATAWHLLTEGLI